MLSSHVLPQPFKQHLPTHLIGNKSLRFDAAMSLIADNMLFKRYYTRGEAFFHTAIYQYNIQLKK